MRALTADGGLMIREAPAAGDGEVVVDVAYAGVCRSDLAVIDGTIPVAPGRVIGHELSGWIDGAPVTVIPFDGPRWLGIDRDGAFADRVVVPARCVRALPRGLSLVHGAYVEPIAAALAVLAVVRAGDRVRVAGEGRIAELTRRVVVFGGAAIVEDGVVDVAIEHDGHPAALVPALRDGGTLVLKSRAPRSIELPAGELVARDLRVRGASHGSFEQAIELLATRALAVDDLLAAPRSLGDFAHVLAAARASEAKKQMFAIGAHR